MRRKRVLAFIASLLAVLTLAGCEEEISYKDLDQTVQEVEVTHHGMMVLNSSEMEETKEATLISELNDALSRVEVQSNLSVDEFCDAVGLRMVFETKSGDELAITYSSIVQDGDCKPMAVVDLNGEKEGYVDGDVYGELESILEDTGDLDW
ncbi:MAG: hypothetical protein ACLFUQ_06080 [Candidatus Izemoplasmataceae bacterium]